MNCTIIQNEINTKYTIGDTEFIIRRKFSNVDGFMSTRKCFEIVNGISAAVQNNFYSRQHLI